MSDVVRGPWKAQPRPPRPPITRAGGYWQWVEFTPCEDIEGDPNLGDGGMVHIPCEVCGPYCEGPDCLCREDPSEESGE